MRPLACTRLAVARQDRAQASRRAQRARRADRQQSTQYTQRARRPRCRYCQAPGNSATGGPWVPIKPPQPGADAFERQLDRIKVARLQIDGYAHALLAVPVRKPVIGDVETNSPFGMSPGSFLGRPAIHTGVDLRGDTGEPVHATATGTVTIASRQGGYGNMVEVDHGNGLCHPLRPSVRDRRQGRPARAHRRSDRQDRLDRPLDRSASALRNADQWRGGRSAEIPARGTAARKQLKRRRWRKRSVTFVQLSLDEPVAVELSRPDGRGDVAASEITARKPLWRPGAHPRHDVVDFLP